MSDAIFPADSPESDANRTAKSPDAFRTISEVAEELDLPQHVLRFWEQKFQQLKPMKRGGGRRYYRADDVQLLKRIKALLYEDGYTIKGVQKLMKQSGGLRHFIDSDDAPDAAAPVTPQIALEAATDALMKPADAASGTGAWHAEVSAVLEELKRLRATLAAAP